jgi:hypothetical protein
MPRSELSSRESLQTPCLALQGDARVFRTVALPGLEAEQARAGVDGRGSVAYCPTESNAINRRRRCRGVCARLAQRRSRVSV